MAMVAQVANNAANAAAMRIGAALSDAQYFESNMVALEQIRRQLDSTSTKDKLDAMKRVIALISLGKDASTFFPEVVKNVCGTSLEVKKLVYLYLVHYAEFKQDLALLAINSFQKDLSDPNEHIRALSLRVLSSIRVKIILQVIIHAIEKAAKDSSSYVRKVAAYAICKVCSLDNSCKDVLLDPLKDLIADRSTQVIGPAIVAFDEITNDDWNIIHPHYRRICRILKNIEPWGQIVVMQMLLRYARANFANPYHQRSNTDTAAENGIVDDHAPGEKAMKTDGEEEENDFYADIPKNGSTTARNADLTLLINSVTPLFFSLNNSVVQTAIAIFYHLATPSEFNTHAMKPLLRLVSVDDDASQVSGLRLASAIAVKFPGALLPYISEFYVCSRHSAPIRDLRMQVLNTICQMAGHKQGLASKPQARKDLLYELQDYLFRADKALAAAAARAIGSIASAHPKSTISIVKLLSSVVSNTKNSVVLTEAINVLRNLLQKHPYAQINALPQLIAMLLNTDEKQNQSVQNGKGAPRTRNNNIGCINEPAARASIVWLIAEFYEQVSEVALEALRILAKGFPEEAAVVKLQILNLGAKLLASASAPSAAETVSDGGIQNGAVDIVVRKKLLEYICTCARFDPNYDVRDKARLLNCLFLTDATPNLRAKAVQALLTKRKEGTLSGNSNNSEGGEQSGAGVGSRGLLEGVILGSMPHVLGIRRIPTGALRLKPWTEVDSPADIRVEAEGSVVLEREYLGISSASFGGGMGGVASSSMGSATATQKAMANLSNMVWNRTPQTVPDAFQRDAQGQVIGFGQPVSGVASDNQPPLASSRPAYAGINVNNIDTEAFYEGSDGENKYNASNKGGLAQQQDDSSTGSTEYETDSEYETDDEEDDDCEEPVGGVGAGALVSATDAATEKVNVVKKKLTGLEDILAGAIPAAAPSQSSPQRLTALGGCEEPMMGEALPLSRPALKTARVVSVEASLMANLDSLNLNLDGELEKKEGSKNKVEKEVE